MAPDAMVVFGRPKGPRRSYKQWEEDDLAPQVVFEVQSLSNGPKDIKEKLDFYDTHGAAEYYLYDPARNRLEVWLRQDGRLTPVAFVNGWTSPRLGIRFALRAKTLEIFDPAGQPFRSPLELARRAREAEARAAQADARVQQADARAEQERVRAEQERARAEQERARAEQERARAEALAERLRALGIDH